MSPTSISIKDQVYNLEADYQLTTQRLGNDQQISPENRQIIRQFVEDKLAMGVIQKTRAVILFDHLRRLARLTSKSFQDFEEKDLMALLAAWEAKGYAQNTKNVTRAILKNLLRSLGKPESWLKGIVNKAAPMSRRAEDLLTEEEILRLIEAAPTLQYKSLLALLAETGCRPGECLRLRIKDCVINGSRLKVYVNGKCGQRIVYAYKSFNLLKEWISIHPQRQNPEAPLWLNRKRTGAVNLVSFSNYFKKISKQAGIPDEKRANAYLLRHSRLTEIYRDFGSILGSKMAGHVIGSKHARVYVHLSENDVIDALDRANGLKEPEKKSQDQNCPCGFVNCYDALSCRKCGKPLNSAGAVVQEAENNSLLEEARQLKGLLADPQILSILQALKDEKVVAALKQAVSKNA